MFLIKFSIYFWNLGIRSFDVNLLKNIWRDFEKDCFGHNALITGAISLIPYILFKYIASYKSNRILTLLHSLKALIIPIWLEMSISDPPVSPKPGESQI